MEKINIFEVSFPMLPNYNNQLSYKNYFMLEDNIDHDSLDIINWEGNPVKIKFVVIIFCIKGRIRIHCNLQDFTISRNDLFIIPPGAIIDGVYTDADNRRGIMFIADYNREYFPKGDVRVHLMSEIKNDPFLIHLNEEAMAHIINGYQMIRRAIADDNLVKKESVFSGYMQVMATYIIESLDKFRQQPLDMKMSRNEQLFRQFIELVRKHYTEHRDVSFYADKMFITAKYLGVVISKVSGRRPIDWIRDYVILDAKAMLLSNKYPIQQISDFLHFANPSFFGKYFKEAVGCAPGKFKKNK